ncbi:MFS transporter [Saccharothrix sp. NRRL B-16314]|uniref:MFS transporter n=1 Tax=Saccharothrix sp. NRRL B-16314 TaxID=1463825 RepID=UPI0005245AC4|nr:MFS transporter [Saccharothrix sp. NRRL B-16314]
MVAVLGGLRANRDLALLAAGSGVSSLGTQLTLVGFTLVLAGSGPSAVAGLFVAAALGAVLGAPLAGWVVDRFRNRMLLAATVCGQVLLLIGLLFGYERVPVLYGLVVLLGLSGGVVRTCGSVLIPLTTGEDQSVRGYAWMSSAQNTGSVAGIVLGGVIAAGPGIEVALLLDAVATFVHLVLVLRLTVDREPGRDEGAPGLGAQWSGTVLLRSDRLLVGRVVAQVVGGVAVAIALVNEVFLVQGPLGGGDFTYSAVLACWTAGLLLGSNAGRRFTTARSLVGAFATAGLVMAVALLAPALIPHVVVNAVAWVVAGACSSVQNVTLNELVRVRTPDWARGRVFAAVGAITVGAGTIGMVAAGAVVAAAGPQRALAVAAAFAVVSALMAGLAVLRRHHLRPPVVSPDFESAPEPAPGPTPGPAPQVRAITAGD